MDSLPDNLDPDVVDPFMESILRIPEVDTIRLGVMNCGRTMSKAEAEVVFDEIDRLRKDRAALDKMCRVFAWQFKERDDVFGRLARIFFERFGET